MNKLAWSSLKLNIIHGDKDENIFENVKVAIG